MGSEPYASAARVFWVVESGSSHCGQASIDRLEGDWPTLRLVHRGPFAWRFTRADLDRLLDRLVGANGR